MIDSPQNSQRCFLWRLALLSILLCIPPGINLLQYWLHNPLYGYGLWVAPLCLYLFWLRREVGGLQASPSPVPALVLGIYLLAVPWLRVAQVANPDWRLLDFILSVGAVTSLLALFYKVGGKSLLKEFWFPACFLLTAVPWSTGAEQAFIGWAIPFTGQVASEVLWTFGIAAVDSGRSLYTSIGAIQVSEDCSGIRSFHLAVMVGMFWISYFRLKKWRAISMGLMTLAITLLLNILRVTAIVFIAVNANQISMVQSWDGPMGSIAQVILLILLPGAAWGLSKSLAKAKPLDSPCPGIQPGSPRTLSTPVILATLGWCIAVEIGVEGWFRLHEKPGKASPGYWALNAHPVGIAVTETPIPDNVKQNYFYSEGHRLVWKDSAEAPWSILYLDFTQGNLSACTHNVHRPEVCLPMSDFNLVSQFEPLRISSAGKEIQFSHQLFQRGDHPVHLFHAYLQDLEDVGSQADWSYQGRLLAAWKGIRSHRAALIHLTVEHFYSKDQARAAAQVYLGKFLERKR